MKNKVNKNTAYKEFFNSVYNEIQNARIDIAASANTVLAKLYFNIGRLIVEKQKEFGWGKSIVLQLSSDLNEITDGRNGYSAQNLWYMRQFFLEYQDKPGLFKFALNIPWGQNLLIISKIKDAKEREYYLKSTAGNGWSRNVLLNQIKGNAYQYYIKNPKKHNFNLALPEHLAEQADEALKSTYNLDFLGLTRPVKERQLENMLVENVKKLLLELGYGFCFIGNQHRLYLWDKYYDVDLLFYHRKLRCLVAIELKTTEFQPEHTGKLDYYLELLNDQIKLPEENPSIGIILCAEKNNLEVEYALKVAKHPIGVAEYQLHKQIPSKYKGLLPAKNDFKKLK